MLKWLSKFVLDILPSVAATIIGAYIVNHYIVPKSPAGAPAAAMATADPKADLRSDSPAADPKAADVRSPADKASGDRPVVEKASFEKGVAEKAAIERAAERAAAEKAADVTGAAGRHRPAKATADRPVAKTPAATVAAVDPAPALQPALASTAAPTADDRRDANELARAAIERLRPAQEPARSQEASRAPAAMAPLPPPITVSTPNAEVFNSGANATLAVPSRAAAVARADDGSRLSPPGDIPGSLSGSITASRPLDLHADSGAPLPRTSVADDVMSAAKSVFHAVLPH